MTPSEIQKLKPAGEGAGDIRAALERIAAARLESVNRRQSAEAEQFRHLAEGASPAQRRKTAEAIEDVDFDLVQLDRLAEELRPLLAAAEARESAAARRAAVAALHMDAEAMDARWSRELPTLTAAIRALIAERQAIAARAAGLGENALVSRFAPSPAWNLPKTQAQVDAERAAAEQAERERQAEAWRRSQERQQERRREAAEQQRLDAERDANPQRVEIRAAS